MIHIVKSSLVRISELLREVVLPLVYLVKVVLEGVNLVVNHVKLRMEEIQFARGVPVVVAHV